MAENGKSGCGSCILYTAGIIALFTIVGAVVFYFTAGSIIMKTFEAGLEHAPRQIYITHLDDYNYADEEKKKILDLLLSKSSRSADGEKVNSLASTIGAAMLIAPGSKTGRTLWLHKFETIHVNSLGLPESEKASVQSDIRKFAVFYAKMNNRSDITTDDKNTIESLFSKVIEEFKKEDQKTPSKRFKKDLTADEVNEVHGLMKKLIKEREDLEFTSYYDLLS